MSIVGMGSCSGKGGKGDKGKPLLHPQRSEVAELRSEVADLRSEVAELRAKLEWTFRALDRQLPLMMPAVTADADADADAGRGLIGKRQRT
jgi:hypothetical protein